MGEASVRAFIALELPAETKAGLMDTQARLRERLHGVRWVNAAGLHLTLRFLGDSTPRQLERVQAALGEATRVCPAGTGRLTGLGVFPESERLPPRVLWVGLELPRPFFALQAACERAAREAGFEPERRAFTPHLTLGRWRDRAPRPTFDELDRHSPSGRGAAAREGAPDSAACLLDTLVLYRSELRPTGALYTALQTFRLSAPPPA